MPQSESPRPLPSGTGPRLALRSLIGSCIGLFLGPSSMLLISFGIYVGAIVSDTGWDRTLVASAIGPTLGISGLMSPLVGWGAGRFGPRRYISFALPAYGVMLMLLGTATSVTMFAALLVLAGFIVSSQTLIPYAYCVSGWFEARRGMALGLILSFSGLGLAVVPPILAHLLAHLGWRATFASAGAFVVLVGLVMPRLLIFDAPAVAATNRSEVTGVLWHQALKMPLFWLLSTLIFIIGCAAAGGMNNLYELMTERGVSRQSASFIMSVVGISMISSRLAFGYLFDRFSAHRVMVLICVMMSAAFVVLASTSGPVGVVVAAVLIGIGFGAEGDSLSYMTSRIFGMRDFAKIFGIAFMAFTLGGGAGPVMFAVLRGRTGNFESALWLTAIACALAAVLASFIKQRHMTFVAPDSRPIASKDGSSALATP